MNASESRTSVRTAFAKRTNARAMQQTCNNFKSLVSKKFILQQKNSPAARKV